VKQMSVPTCAGSPPATTKESALGPAVLDLDRWCHSTDEELATLDIAALNLMCAAGLPGAENLDPDRYCAWLDNAARQVEFQTRRHWYRFRDSPKTYHVSPGYFCCSFLLQTLQEDFKVRYNPAKARDPNFQDLKCHPDFRDSRDQFIHGIIDGPGGTCASMPVLYVAVGRRLGYPLKLVETRGHLFIRWDDPSGKRFHAPEILNIDGAGEGMAMYPDAHYREWPEKWTAADEEGGWFLKSLTPREELAAFLVMRAACLEDNGRRNEAVQACVWARDLAPHDGRYVRLAESKANRLAFQRHQEVALMLESTRRHRERMMQGLSSGQEKGVSTIETKPPHGNSCRCASCEAARAAAAAPRTAFGHAEGCQCFHCLQIRRLAPQPTAVGHPRGCPCPFCRPVDQHRLGISAHWGAFPLNVKFNSLEF